VDASVPEIRISQPQLQPEPEPSPTGHGAPTGAAQEPSAIRTFLLSRGNSAFADGVFHALMVLCALSIFVIVALIAYQLVDKSQLSWAQLGIKFFYTAVKDPVTGQPRYWDPVNGNFSALPFVYGTLVSSFLALLLAVPLAVGVAIFLTEMCPGFLRAPLAFLTELLAAIPSIIYGLWALFVLVPLLRHYVNPVLVKGLGWTGLFDDTNPTGLGFFASAVILAIMILPIISSLTREVMTAVPYSQREAVLALGATRWEMIRMGVLRNARIGIVGAIILGLGRALGETMAVLMVIGNTPEIHKSLLATGTSMASVIANEFAEAINDLHRSALVEIGLALFVVTIIVNAIAQLLVWAVTRGTPSQAH
jgi:phosphate transport system permease protein